MRMDDMSSSLLKMADFYRRDHAIFLFNYHVSSATLSSILVSVCSCVNPSGDLAQQKTFMSVFDLVNITFYLFEVVIVHKST